MIGIIVRRYLAALLILTLAVVAANTYFQKQRRRKIMEVAERQRTTAEARTAIRKTVEFLKPDIASDLRFGKTAVAKTVATPAIP